MSAGPLEITKSFFLVVKPRETPNHKEDHISVTACNSNIYHKPSLVGGFNLPLWKMMEWKSVGMVIPNIWKNGSHVPNHQPATNTIIKSVWIEVKRSNWSEPSSAFTAFCKDSDNSCRLNSRAGTQRANYFWPQTKQRLRMSPDHFLLGVSDESLPFLWFLLF